MVARAALNIDEAVQVVDGLPNISEKTTLSFQAKRYLYYLYSTFLAHYTSLLSRLHHDILPDRRMLLERYNPTR